MISKEIKLIAVDSLIFVFNDFENVIVKNVRYDKSKEIKLIVDGSLIFAFIENIIDNNVRYDI